MEDNKVFTENRIDENKLDQVSAGADKIHGGTSKPKDKKAGSQDKLERLNDGRLNDERLNDDILQGVSGGVDRIHGGTAIDSEEKKKKKTIE